MTLAIASIYCWVIFLQMVFLTIDQGIPSAIIITDISHIEIERVQKRALSIMNPSHTYEANLAQFGLATLHKRRQELCDNQFERISTTSHKLSYLLPPNHCPNHHLRKCHEYHHPQIHTDRFKHSFIPAMCAGKEVFKNLIYFNISSRF